jgi:hypothetical protein
VAREYFIGGEKGECIFTELFLEWSPRGQDLPGFLNRIEATGDDRSFVF